MDYGRKQESLEKTYAYIERTCKNHAEKFRSGFKLGPYLLKGSNTKHFATTKKYILISNFATDVWL